MVVAQYTNYNAISECVLTLSNGYDGRNDIHSPSESPQSNISIMVT